MNLPLGTNCLSMARIILVSMIPSSLFVITVTKQDQFFIVFLWNLSSMQDRIKFSVTSSIKLCVSNVEVTVNTHTCTDVFSVITTKDQSGGI